jgi:hypothetical protein
MLPPRMLLGYERMHGEIEKWRNGEREKTHHLDAQVLAQLLTRQQERLHGIASAFVRADQRPLLGHVARVDLSEV